MRRAGGRSVAVLLAAVAVGAPLAAQSPAVAAIDSLMADQLPAGNAHDAVRFLSAFAHDSTLVFVFNGTVISGYDSLLAQQRRWWANPAPGVEYVRTAPPEVTLLGPGSAFAVDRLAARRTLPSGEVKMGAFVVLLVWQLRPEGWRIVAAHESTAR